MKARVFSLVNHTHATAAELFENAVVRDGLPDKGLGVSHLPPYYGPKRGKSTRREQCEENSASHGRLGSDVTTRRIDSVYDSVKSGRNFLNLSKTIVDLQPKALLPTRTISVSHSLTALALSECEMKAPMKGINRH